MLPAGLLDELDLVLDSWPLIPLVPIIYLLLQFFANRIIIILILRSLSIQFKELVDELLKLLEVLQRLQHLEDLVLADGALWRHQSFQKSCPGVLVDLETQWPLLIVQILFLECHLLLRHIGALLIRLPILLVLSNQQLVKRLNQRLLEHTFAEQFIEFSESHHVFDGQVRWPAKHLLNELNGLVPIFENMPINQEVVNIDKWQLKDLLDVCHNQFLIRNVFLFSFFDLEKALLHHNILNIQPPILDNVKLLTERGRVVGLSLVLLGAIRCLVLILPTFANDTLRTHLLLNQIIRLLHIRTVPLIKSLGIRQIQIRHDGVLA